MVCHFAHEHAKAPNVVGQRVAVPKRLLGRASQVRSDRILAQQSTILTFTLSLVAVSIVHISGKLLAVRETGQLDLTTLSTEDLICSDISVQNFGLVRCLYSFGDAVKSVLQKSFSGSLLQQ